MLSPADSATAPAIEQILIEGQCVDRAVARFRETVRQAPVHQTAGGRWLLQDMMVLLAPAIQTEQEAALRMIVDTAPGVRPVWCWYLPLLRHDKIAFIALRALLNVPQSDSGQGLSALQVCVAIARGMAEQLRFESSGAAGAASAASGFVQMMLMLAAQSPSVSEKRRSKWTDKLKGLPWSIDDRLHVGAKVLQIVTTTCSRYVEVRMVAENRKTERRIILSDDARQLVTDVTGDIEATQALLRPMVVRPHHWTWDAEQRCYVGGYHLISENLFGRGRYRHSAALDAPLSPETLDALNHLGDVAWQIDPAGLTLLRDCLRGGEQAFSLLAGDAITVRQMRMQRSRWDALSLKGRAAWKRAAAQRHRLRASGRLKREAVARKLVIAEEFARYPSIFFPHKLDSRTRMYPIPNHVHPQSDGIGRGLLRFAAGERLGPRGLYWLEVRLAHAYGAGAKRLAWDQYEPWVRQHLDLIRDSVERPLNGQRFWAKAEHKLEFFQTAVELVEAMDMDAPERFVSHLPIKLDGSNNSLQILSLLGRDPVGAKATNCSADTDRHDFYQEVAEVVKKLVSADAAGGRSREAEAWVDKIDRATVKRATMTFAFGVTPRGIREQLLEGGHCDGLPGLPSANASYLTARILDALDCKVVAARSIMTYLREVARALTLAGLPLVWRTPSGSLCRQAYFKLVKRDVRTVLGSIWLREEGAARQLVLRKQVSGASANVVHSIDAALAQIVCNRLRVHHGIESFISIHDSFGVHACHVDAMRQEIGAAAAELFGGDWLRNEFHTYVRERAPGVILPEPPVQGSFDPGEVRAAPYFFA